MLDIGCGYGGFYNILKKMKKRINYTGIDFNEDMIINAKKNIQNQTSNITLAQITKIF